MNEILKGMIYIGKYDDENNKIIKEKIYHIYYNNGCVFIDAPFPVKYMNKLRKYLEYKNIKYKNIIIGKPDI